MQTLLNTNLLPELARLVDAGLLDVGAVADWMAAGYEPKVKGFSSGTNSRETLENGMMKFWELHPQGTPPIKPEAVAIDAVPEFEQAEAAETIEPEPPKDGPATTPWIVPPSHLGLTRDQLDAARFPQFKKYINQGHVIDADKTGVDIAGVPYLVTFHDDADADYRLLKLIPFDGEAPDRADDPYFGHKCSRGGKDWMIGPIAESVLVKLDGEPAKKAKRK